MRSATRTPACEERALENLIEAPGPGTPPPKVTILIPTYNQERFIDKAVASALGQDYPSIEVVVVDDASTDRTGETARLWSFDRRFRYVRNDRNLGRVANYRRGLNELARGQWVLMLDGDDFLADHEFIRRACEAIERHAERPIVFAQAGHRVHYLDGSRGDVDILPPIDGPGAKCWPAATICNWIFPDTSFFTHLVRFTIAKAAIEVGFLHGGHQLVGHGLVVAACTYR